MIYEIVTLVFDVPNVIVSAIVMVSAVRGIFGKGGSIMKSVDREIRMRPRVWTAALAVSIAVAALKEFLEGFPPSGDDLLLYPVRSVLTGISVAAMARAKAGLKNSLAVGMGLGWIGICLFLGYRMD
ncbi:hypothetical protein [Actinocorallia sp. A-T 12471]|uniref:hypothetical protein n=1 Tax=Actinocorallia sp. A-T 12471 TaxID=3089813 RepID=UPI0029D0E7AE|nr:hypothetical protein [Actinocorallia sp. A-T 12471]MDX6740467.1 hypothetical protein [Actinocorallia sp. A-T 12471]